jgi:hypothetical protein
MVKGRPVPSELLAEMWDSSSLLGRPEALRERMSDDGYLLLRGVLDPDAVRAARAEVLARIEAVGEAVPGSDGIFTGRSRRAALEPDLGAFWQSVSEGPRVRAVSHSVVTGGIAVALAGEDARPQDYLFLRVGVQGRATELHFDYPFFARMHDRVWTVWLPVGDVPMERGPLAIVEGSHRFTDLIESVNGFDVALNRDRKAALGVDAISFVESRGARLLTADFKAGDLAIFGMYTLHGSLDHHDPTGRVRVSCDLRWQAASMPIDERYFGPHPAGTTGAGYGELNGAKPLDQPWHVR